MSQELAILEIKKSHVLSIHDNGVCIKRLALE